MPPPDWRWWKDCRYRLIAVFDTIIDVSQHQGVIDWQAAQASGVHKAIIRATMGVAGVDTCFDANALETRIWGVQRGFYHLFRPEHEGAPQADFFWAQIMGRDADYLVAVDVELDGSDVGQPQTPAVLADKLKAFVVRYHQLSGMYPAVYSGRWFWDPKVGGQHDAFFDANCALWLAEYGDKITALPRGWTHWDLWQFTSSGSVAGISGRVDMNREPEEAPFTLLFPVKAPDGCRIVVTSRFGTPRDYDGDGVKDDKHEGVDWAPIGSACLPEIVAGADGVVSSIGTVGAYGNRVKLRHAHNGDTYYSWYCHLSRIDVTVGHFVSRGQRIGVMGNTGNSTAPHVHVNLQWIGHGLDGFVISDAVDPLPYIVYE